MNTTASALDLIVREWGLIPAMPTAEMAQTAEDRMLARVRSSHGEAETATAWLRFGRNKGWHE